MRHFTVVPTHPLTAPAQITSLDESAVLNIINRRQFDEANVFEDDTYRFSLRTDGNEVWCIFQREDPMPNGGDHA